MHGGPTWQEVLVQVNYVGSSGYGKEYINLVNFQWCVSNVADAVSCVEYLAKEGLIDPNRVGITGHSVGGYVVQVSECLGRRDSGIGDFRYASYV
jgi:prolyl oligopeptidase PreP (S9A serine peptidase family)